MAAIINNRSMGMYPLCAISYQPKCLGTQVMLQEVKQAAYFVLVNF